MRILLLLLAFLVLGWSYWLLSGGSDFRPETRAQAEADGPESPIGPEPVESAASAAAPPGIADPETAAAEPLPDAAPVAPDEPPSSEGPALERVTAVQPTAAEEPPAPVAEEPASAPLSAAEALAAIDSDLTAPRQRGRLEVASAGVGGDQRRVTADRVNLRQGPGVEHGVLDQVDAGDTAEVLEQDGGWVRVRLPGGTEGWMSARFLARQDG